MARSTKKAMEEKRKAIEACRDKHGRILPKLVVAAARNPRSPLHREFEWDDKKAAEIHRLDRAQALIREVKVSFTVDDVKFAAPYFVSDPSSRESAYVPTTAAAKDEELSEVILMDELRRIESAVIRARSIAAAFDLQSHFDRMLDDVVAVRGKVSRRRLGGEDRPTA